ncbi:hypothetical protein H2248_007967 [Termitomyces sp. 'cryptogamus']|nr:hypothetical protein H2248_007967 [Termitomyces sp. 'cryptogamus']
MMARGKVAFLIASIAQGAGIFTNGEIYMVIIWAAMLCTIIGPIGTGIIVKSMAIQQQTETKPLLPGAAEDQTSDL